MLLIESSGDCPFVALAENGKLINSWYSPAKGGFSIHEIIEKLFSTSGKKITELDAVAVTEGPGSYTGLRVGMAAAKGICYALRIPMITVSTLRVMALAARNEALQIGADSIYPMIDARRDEVFLAAYDINMNEKVAPGPYLIGSGEWDTLFASKKSLCCGSGAAKIPETYATSLMTELPAIKLTAAMADISLESLRKNMTADILRAEPSYLKPFYLNK